MLVLISLAEITRIKAVSHANDEKPRKTLFLSGLVALCVSYVS